MTSIISLLVDPSVQPVLPAPWRGLPVERQALQDAHILAARDDGETIAFLVYDTFEFLAAISRRELLGRAAKLTEMTPWAYIIITGTLAPGKSNGTIRNGHLLDHWKWHSIAGAFDTLTQAGVSVLQVAEENDMPPLVTMLAKRHRDAAHRVSPPSPLMFRDPAMDLLMALPGIGEERAEVVLRTVGDNVANALELLTGPESSLPAGIGPKTRADIRAMLGLTDPELGIRVAPIDDEPNFRALCAGLLDEIADACDPKAELLATMGDAAAQRLLSWRDRLRAAVLPAPQPERPDMTDPAARAQAKAEMLDLFAA